MTERLRQVHDRDLSAAQLAERERWRRKHEIDAQIVVAIEKGNDVELLLTHPAGLIENRGGCRWLNYTPGDETLRPRQRQGYALEVAYIRQRFADLKSRFDAGQEFVDLDAAIASEVAGGKKKGDKKLNALSEIKVRCTKAKRGEHGPEAQKFARARGHKDLSEFRYKERGVEAGWLHELTTEELTQELSGIEESAVREINARRAELGRKPVRIVEE